MIDYFVLALKRSFDFAGRSRRSEYWYFVLGNFILSIIAMAIDTRMFSELENDRGTVGTIVTLLLLIPGLTVLFRRLHDIGKSAWWCLIFLIPLVNLVMMFVWLARDSEADNEYGPNPKINGSRSDQLAHFD